MAILPDRTELTTPADGDLYVTTDVSDTTDAATGTDKKITWANVKAGLKTYFDTLYAPTAHTHLLAAGATDVTASAAELNKLDGLAGAVVGTTDTQTLTNKRVNPRTASSTTDATLTPDLSAANVYFRTTQTEALTIGAPTGTPVIGETIAIYVDSVGAQTLTMNATYKVFGATFPSTTTAGKTLMITAQYDGTNWKTLWSTQV